MHDTAKTSLNRLLGRSAAVLLFSALMALLVYREALWMVIQSVLQREDSSHGLFVPLLMIVFLWSNRRRLAGIRPRYQVMGVPLILMGLSFPLMGIDAFQLHFIGWILCVLGLVACLMGSVFLRHLAFPILFLVAMTPLPDPLYQQAADLLRSINFWLSLKILDLFNVPYFRDGWLLQLPDAMLRVAIGCSGIRYLISYFVFSAAYGYLFKATPMQRMLTVAMSIPIALFASTLRLSSIFLLSYFISPVFAERWPHIFVSWTVFFAVLIFSIWLDQAISQRRNQPTSQEKGESYAYN